MAVVADIANFIREGKVADARHALTTREEPLYRTIDGLVRQVVATEQARMGSLRASAIAADRRSRFVMGGFAVLTIGLAMFFGFVISWSFILPVRRADEFLGRSCGGEFRCNGENPQPR